MRLNNQGFTVIEGLLIAMLVAMMLSVTYFSWNFGRGTSASQYAKDTIEEIVDGLDSYYADNGFYPESLTELVEKDYLDELPKPEEDVSGATDRPYLISYDAENTYIDTEDFRIDGVDVELLFTCDNFTIDEDIYLNPDKSELSQRVYAKGVFPEELCVYRDSFDGSLRSVSVMCGYELWYQRRTGDPFGTPDAPEIIINASKKAESLNGQCG